MCICCCRVPKTGGVMCRKLDPDLALKVPWTQEEDEMLLHLQEVHDNHWAEMAKSIKGRNAQMCRTGLHIFCLVFLVCGRLLSSYVSSCLHSAGEK